jgi:hypothetical protein
MQPVRLMAKVSVIYALCAMGATAEPIAPCESMRPSPAYAALDDAPVIQIWNLESLRVAWRPPVCSDWSASSSGVLIAVAGRIRVSGGLEDILERFGAISALQGIQYWSVTDKAWRPLVKHATALTVADINKWRADFSAAELRAGHDLYYAQRDSRSSADVIYRLRVVDATASRVVISIQNVTPVRLYLLNLFKPGDLQTLYFLDHESADVWGYYGLARAAASKWLPSGHEASYVNRATAQFRFIARLPAASAAHQ